MRRGTMSYPLGGAGQPGALSVEGQRGQRGVVGGDHSDGALRGGHTQRRQASRGR